jgi:hypothetical protein
VVVTQRYLQLLVLCNAWRRSHDAQEMTQVGSSITTHEMSLRVERVERGIRRFDDSTIRRFDDSCRRARSNGLSPDEAKRLRRLAGRGCDWLAWPHLPF